MTNITFIKPFYYHESLLLIMYNDMIIGSIQSNNNIIIDIDINTFYLNEIKDKLMRLLLFHVGRDDIILVCEKVFEDWYKELGFKKIKNKDGKVVMIYNIGKQYRGGQALGQKIQQIIGNVQSSLLKHLQNKV